MRRARRGRGEAMSYDDRRPALQQVLDRPLDRRLRVGVDVLRHEGQPAPQIPKRDIPEPRSVDQYLPQLRLIEAKQQAEEGARPRAGRADQGHQFTWRNADLPGQRDLAANLYPPLFNGLPAVSRTLAERGRLPKPTAG